MKAVVTVIGRDCIGIIADVSTKCASYGANILDIRQTVLREYFAMIMLTELDKLNLPFADFAAALAAFGKEKGLEILVNHEDIFNSMHHI